MGRTPKPRFAVVFLMIFGLGMSLGLAAQDVLERVYDESETLPFEMIVHFSIALRPMVARAPQEAPLGLIVPSWSSAARACDADAQRSGDTRVSLALLCTLLC